PLGQPRTRLQQQQPIAFRLLYAGDYAARSKKIAACLLGYAMGLIRRAEIADKDLAHDAVHGRADKRGQGARQRFLVVLRFDQDAQHPSYLEQKRPNRKQPAVNETIPTIQIVLDLFLS